MDSMNVIERSTVIAADRERIWRAITTPEHFSKWFGGDIRFDRLEVGATMTFAVGGQTGIATIAAVEKPAKFAFYWTPEAGNPTRTLVTFLLETVAEGTRVTVTDAGYDALPESVRRARFEMNDEGWTIQLRNIADYLQKTKMSSHDERVFIALADSTRRDLLATLAESSPKTATQLAQEFPITRQGILKHLDVLAAAGLVQVRPKGREKRYWLAPGNLQSVSAWIEAIGAKWDVRLQRLKDLVESDEEL